MGFTVTRRAQSLVGPSGATPSETLRLSIIDRVAGLRHLVRSLHVFARSRDRTATATESESESEPARAIRGALGEALVRYYPFAGRFVEGADGEVRVECNGEGVFFTEAAANCSLEEVRYLDHPMAIHQDQLLPDPTPEIDPINLPLMLQVTEFTCGGFVVGLVSVHTIADGLGAGQLVNAIGELARGLARPTVEPIWARELIPSPPKLPPGPPPVFPTFKLQYYTTDLSPAHVNKVKAQYFESVGQRCSTFDVAIAKAWQARTRAIQLGPDEQVRVCFFANTRHLLPKDREPAGFGFGFGFGFYGNCFYPVTVTATSRRVAMGELIEVVRIIREAKARLPGQFAKWAVGDFEEDPYELSFTYDSLFVSDWTRLGFLEVDYGWGPPVHVMPFAYYQFMAVAIIGAPPAPQKGTRLMTQCVEKDHLQAFQDELKTFSSDASA
ncbi:10-deacetylbaccatin III 10-O-acetyltransferase [Ananas comosus]|uniref:10-deacetylbaccatin III 10-O-acetyltransferase n=1 Tax=Ananas comosus TaxID=4615 RepID=A0A199V9U2_ANACO|nr:10-deacetylbaccatin III 10-O-acetyltransferase [Ananas comosus]